MAEINIERKKRPVWPWILLIVLLALVGWVVYEYMNDRNVTTSQVNQPAPDWVMHPNPAIQQQHFAIT